MWIVKYKDEPRIRFQEKKSMLEYLDEQSPAVRPHLTYEEKRGIEPKKPTHPG